MRTRHVLVLLLLALALAPASAAAAPGWDPSPLTVAGPLYESPKSGPVVETTDDGAVWVAWLAYDATAAQTSAVVRRISPEGVPGEPRVLMSEAFTFQSGTVALAPLPGGDVRVAYPVEDSGEVGLRTRRLGPTTTGDAVPLLTATTGDGLRADSVKLLAAPGSAVWATFGHGSSPSTLTAARIPDTGAPSSPVTVATDYGAYDAAVNPMSGQLVVLTAPSNSNGPVDATRLTTTPSVESAVEVRAPQPQTDVSEPGIAIAADGVATAVWRMSPAATSGRTIEARRISTVDPAPLSVQGSVTRLDGTPGEAPVFPGPVVAADPGGAALAGWPQWTTDTYTFTDSFARPLPAGALTTAAGLASISALTGTAATLSDLVPGGDGTFTAHAFVQAPNNDGSLTACRAVRLTSSGGLIDDHTLAATGCTLSTGPVSAANGNAAVWATTENVIRVSRLVTSAPACDPVTAVTVQAGASVTVPLACGGWRPVRAITAQPARGTLGAIDDDAATVTYTAGTVPGTDAFTFRAANGAGAGDEVTVPITVTPRPLPAGALTTAAGLASFSALTGTAAYVNDLVPGGDGTFTAHAFVQAPNNDGNLTACRAVRLTSSGGLIDDHTLAATGCTLSTGPVSAANGNAAVWATTENVIRVSRLVTSAPACDPVTAVTVQAGASVTVPLACGGWRPVRAITAQPARGTLGAIDDDAATVTYTAGTVPGTDAFTFRAANGAGAGDEVTVPITVTPRPLPPSPPAAPTPARDSTAPAITKLSLTPRLVVRTAPRTPTLRFTLSEAASITVTLERTITGRRVGGRCVAPTTKRVGARCTRTVPISTAVRQAPAGAAKLAIAVGKGGRVLAAGSYRVSVSARDAAGNASAAQRASLTIAAR